MTLMNRGFIQKPEIYRLVYISNAKHLVDIDELRRIEEKSKINNQFANVTGILLYKHGRFMQFLEGEKSDVQKIFSSIKKDPMHENITIISQGIIQKRQFLNWSMKYVPLCEVQNKLGIIHHELFDRAANYGEETRQAEDTMNMLCGFKYADAHCCH